MNAVTRLIAACLIPMPSFAAIQTMPIKARQPIIEDGVRRYESLRLQPQFRVEVISDEEGLKAEAWKNGRPFVTARENERFAIRLYNPMPVRVGVNLTIDGLNSITGKPSGIEDGEKWLIEPYSFITIKGWQVNNAEARRFFFTDKHESYAKWRGDHLGKDLAANCGVIGAAYFWSRRELAAYYDSNPVYKYRQPEPWSSLKDEESLDRRVRASAMQSSETAAAAEGRGRLDLAQALAAKKAGTGMGERESFRTTQVSFDYDTGMKTLAQAVVIYYDFARAPEPNPFPALSFAPEAP